jgi:DNA-binding SARP family transcriptional activator
MTTYSLRCFGPSTIVDQRGQVVPMRSRKQLALLVYLATEQCSAHSRESLLALFWPEETAASAQNNLRVTLSRLRQVAEKLLATIN